MNSVDKFSANPLNIAASEECRRSANEVTKRKLESNILENKQEKQGDNATVKNLIKSSANQIFFSCFFSNLCYRSLGNPLALAKAAVDKGFRGNLEKSIIF